jgi:transposase
VACRLYAAGCELVPGGVSKEISAAQATQILQSIGPSGAVTQARRGLAAEDLDDLRRLDAQLSQTRKKLAIAVQAVEETRVRGPSPALIIIPIGANPSRARSRARVAGGHHM